MDVAEVRRRVRSAIDAARRRGHERRLRSDQAAREYEVFLRDRAVPLFHTFASALVAEGHRFKVFTPAGTVRLALESSAEDYIELALDTSLDPPAVVGTTSRGRGRRQIASERPLKDAVTVAELTEEDVLAFLIEEITPFLER